MVFVQELNIIHVSFMMMANNNIHVQFILVLNLVPTLGMIPQ